MSSFNKALLVVLAVGTLVTGCSKKPSCPAGAYENKDPAFCMSLPAGFKADPPQGGTAKSMRVSGGVDNGFASYTVYWGDDDKKSLDERAKIGDNMASSSFVLLEKGDVPSGKWWRFRTEQGTIFGQVLVQGAKGIIRCEIQNSPEDAAKKMLDSCKSLHAD